MKVYKITNNINEKIYIGSTKESLEQRFKNHNRHAKTIRKHKIHKAMYELGFENFKIELLYEGEDAKDMEEYYIQKYLKDGYELYNTQRKSNISKKFYSYDLETEAIELHEKVDTKLYNPGKISEVLNFKKEDLGKKYCRTNHKNKLWSYLNEEENWNFLKSLYKKRTKPIINITENIKFESIVEANLYYGLTKEDSRIRNALKNKIKALNCYWEYL